MQRRRSKRSEDVKTAAKAVSSAGFSLLEVIVAIAILAFGLLSLAVMQLEALTQGAAGKHTTDSMMSALLHQPSRRPPSNHSQRR